MFGVSKISFPFRFWWQVMAIALNKPRLLYDYITTLGVGEHFFNYRYVVREPMVKQLEALKQHQAQEKPEESYQLSAVS
jgi:hypothetical protein